MQMIFGDNFIQINPEDLTSQFNSVYATKNLIALDETVIDKSHAVEKLKSIATAKTISVNQKFVANYAIPFFSKVIICTNKEKDFMRIDEEEIRFWIRKISSISAINTNIEDELRDEIPYFLRYLMDQPEIDRTKSRMVFTAKEIRNQNLEIIQKESWSWLKKELYIHLENFFNENPEVDEFKANATEIKKKWFEFDHKVSASYLLKIFTDEMKLDQLPQHRYTPFADDPLSKSRGMPFLFTRQQFGQPIPKESQASSLPF
jgi:hypothetical protein